MPMKGASITDSTTFSVATGDHKWEGHGFELSIPEGSVDSSTATMKIYASTKGEYQLPDNTTLVSGVYWISCPHKFTKEHPVTLKIQHCVKIKHPKQLDSLSFVAAKCTQKTLPYKFKIIPGGVFSTGNNIGSIQLTHFSAAAIVWIKRLFGYGEESGETGMGGREEGSKENMEQECVVRAYHFPSEGIDLLTHIVITWDLELVLKVWTYIFVLGISPRYHLGLQKNFALKA